jgi:hypothetical protein
MSDENRPHHSNGVCLHCGGRVDDGGMSLGGDDESTEGAEDMSGGPVGDGAEDMAADNAREFALSLSRAR